MHKSSLQKKRANRSHYLEIGTLQSAENVRQAPATRLCARKDAGGSETQERHPIKLGGLGRNCVQNEQEESSET
jgi:hypothetical protein